MRRVGVLTSGGDAPGMNAGIRAVVRAALAGEWEVVGVRNGYSGLVGGELRDLGSRDVSNIIQRGGTILGTSRCEVFRTPEGRARAARNLTAHGVEGLVVIGGDGSFHGAHALHEEFAVPVIGMPGTIDNDLFGTDFTIGYDTAVNTALEAIDKIRDTAASHSRLFFVEVMGRQAGFIAIETAIGGGAEEVLVPEESAGVEEICQRIRAGLARGKASSLVVVAEGDELGGAEAIARQVEARLGMEAKVTILGHIQRGGSPTARDRVLASRLGAAAIQALGDGLTDVMAGEVGGRILFTPLVETWTRKKSIDTELLSLVRVLAR